MNSNSIESEIKQSGTCVTTITGKSMWPMLRERKDLIVLKKAKGRLKRHDIPLYKAYGGKYVLHRVLKVTKNGYVIRGDNCCKNEYNISDSQILGVVTAFYRNNKYIDCKNIYYRMYIYLWRFLYFPRFLLFKLKHCAIKIRNSFPGGNFFGRQK